MGLALNLLKWSAIVVGGLAGVLAAALLVVYFLAGAKLNEIIEVEVAASRYRRMRPASSAGATW